MYRTPNPDFGSARRFALPDDSAVFPDGSRRARPLCRLRLRGAVSDRTCMPAGLPLARLAFPTGAAASAFGVLRRFALPLRLRRPRLAARPWTVSRTWYRFGHQPMLPDLSAKPHPDTAGGPHPRKRPRHQVSPTGLTEPWTSAGLRQQVRTCPTTASDVRFRALMLSHLTCGTHPRTPVAPAECTIRFCGEPHLLLAHHVLCPSN